MKVIRIGVDLAKNVFQVHGVDRFEKPVWRKKLSRANWIDAVREVAEPGCEIGMEACGGRLSRILCLSILLGVIELLLETDHQLA